MIDDPLANIDFGADFEDYAVGLQSVTIRSVDPDEPSTTLVTAEDVPAAKLVTKADTVSARTGEVGHTTCDWWFRTDRLEFTPKPRDQIEEADGTVWLIDGAELDGIYSHELTKCSTTKSRSH